MDTITKTSSAKGEREVTVASFAGMPEAPDAAQNVKTSHADGIYTLSYTIADDEGDSGGGGDAPTPPGVTVVISGNVSMEPLAVAPRYAQGISDEEWAKWNRYEKGDLSWDPFTQGSEIMSEYAQKRSTGQDSFLDGGATMRVTETELRKPGLVGLGKIQAPPYAPAVQGDRNWLLVGIDAVRTGQRGAWTVTREYRLSGPGGWDPDIYK